MLMKKDMNNVEIADLLRAIAASYQIEDKEDNIFKIIAYERAADAIEHLSSEAKDLYDEDKLDDIPGVGKSISSYLSEIFKTGKSEHFNEILKNVPDSVFEIIPLEGIGPKQAYRLVKLLKISSNL
jgi:DNA polymerase (family 10)